MVVAIITVQSVLNGVTMKETFAQKRKGVARLKEPELTLAPKMRSASPQRSSLSARYPVNGAWPAEMRIDMLAAYLDFRTVRALYQPSKVLTLFCKATPAVILFCLTEL